MKKPLEKNLKQLVGDRKLVSDYDTISLANSYLRDKKRLIEMNLVNDETGMETLLKTLKKNIKRSKCLEDLVLSIIYIEDWIENCGSPEDV